jgi:hypothetical protein
MVERELAEWVPNYISKRSNNPVMVVEHFVKNYLLRTHLIVWESGEVMAVDFPIIFEELEPLNSVSGQASDNA